MVDTTITDLQNDIDDIKQELGLTPQGVYADVRVRLDILETRIGNTDQPTNVENPFFIGSDGVSISTGNGVPIENRLNGSIFLRKDGNATDGVYTRQGNSWFPVGSAGAATFQAVAGGTIAKGQALRTTTSGNVIVATTNLRTLPFDCVSKAGAASSSTFDIQIAGPLDPGVANLGAGVACAVGVDASGNLVRATDPACVSAPNWVGTCDVLGNITINPIRKDFFDVRDFGAIPDWNGTTGTDNLAAFTACMAATEIVSGIDRGMIDIFCPGSYYLSNTFNLTHTVLLRGSGDGGDENRKPGTMLVFPGGINGIRIHSTLDGIYNSNGTCIRDMVIHCKDALGAWHDPGIGSGIWASAVCYLSNLTITGFGLHGIRIETGTLESPGNADACGISHVRVGLCNGHGIYMRGNDSQICTISQCEFVVNTGFGVFEGSAGGNIYVGVHCEGNQGNLLNITGSITSGTTALTVNDSFSFMVGMTIKIAGVSGNKKVLLVSGTAVTIDIAANATVTNARIDHGFVIDSANHDYFVKPNSSTLIGCYTEFATNSMDSSTVIGGPLGQSRNTSVNAFQLEAGIAQNAPFVYETDKGTVPVRIQMGEPSNAQRAFVVQGDNGNFWTFDYEDTRGVWMWRRNNAGFWSMGFPTAVTNIRAPNTVAFRTGLYIGQPGGPDIDNCSLIIAQDTIPVSGTWKLGDITFNQSPTTSGTVGWICTTAGTPGTWTPFGGIVAVIRSTTISTSLASGIDRVLSIGTLSGIITVTLPASPTSGDEFIIKDANGSAASHNITIDGNGHNIDANTTFLLTTDYDDVTVKYNGTKWMVL